MTVCRNAASTIRRTIESVLSQDYAHFDYTVIDGASTDGTLSIIKEYAGRLDWTSAPDAGYSDAVNKGIRSGEQGWVHLINGDDCYSSASALSEAMSQVIDDRLNYCSILRTWPDGTGKRLPFCYEARWPVRDHKFPFWSTSSMLHPGMIISRDQYRRVGLYDGRWLRSSDIDLILRLLRTYRPHYIPLVLVHVQQDGMSQQNKALTASEFAQITVVYGFPRLLAWLIYYAKMDLIWPLLALTDQFWRSHVKSAFLGDVARRSE